MFGALKLGVAATAGYAVGGQLGKWAVAKISPKASDDVVTGATWGGRIATFLVVAAILGK